MRATTLWNQTLCNTELETAFFEEFKSFDTNRDISIKLTFPCYDLRFSRSLFQTSLK
jgi:hypothetical protein